MIRLTLSLVILICFAYTIGVAVDVFIDSLFLWRSKTSENRDVKAWRISQFDEYLATEDATLNRKLLVYQKRTMRESAGLPLAGGK